MNPITQKLVSSILTGFVAKLLRYAIAAAGTAYVGANSADGINVTEAATEIVSVGGAIAWSAWEDWKRSKQTNQALVNVAAGQSPAQAIEDTTTLKKTDVASVTAK